MSHAARALVEGFERSVDPDTRRATGVHYTPPPIARLLVDEAIRTLGRVPRTVFDPACGAGSFLLAAADALLALGVPADEVVRHRLRAAELDPAAAAVATDSLRLWAAENGTPRAEPAAVWVGDSLFGSGLRAERIGADLVVGNPPFLGQLSRRTARTATQRADAAARVGSATRYADTASLFLLGALDAVGPDGVVAMVQPQSFLSARDGAGTRDALRGSASLVSLWSTEERVFDASVHVCAAVLRKGSAQGPVRILRHLDPAPVARVDMVPAGSTWGPLLASARGVPTVPATSGPTVSTIAMATAGFRDEYYALRDASFDDSEDPGPAPGAPATTDGSPRLLTVGAVEPGWHDWGRRACRLGGRSLLRPRADETLLAGAAPRVGRWVAARRVPKVLVATQTRILEAAADPEGAYVPVTPLISVEPGPGTDVWSLTAALLAPPVSALAVASQLGTGLSADAVRWSASTVSDLCLPVERVHWDTGAGLCRDLAAAEPGAREVLLDRLGAVMCLAHGLDADHPVRQWWFERACRR